MAETRRGFTGHEHLVSVGLVHMNGRVYDPEIGRFLSADPFVQAPETTQGFNRYSYVNNNPLSYTDPSGFFFKKLFKTFKQLIPAIATILIVTALCGPAALVCGTVGYAIAGAIAAAAMTGITTLSYGGSATDALTGAAIAAGAALASAGMAQGFGNAAAAAAGQTASHAVTAIRVVAHGLVGGVTSALRGGKFVAGLAAGAFASAASPLIGLVPGGIGQTLAAAVVGGTASELGGGKFANGAFTASFAYLFSNAGQAIKKAGFASGKEAARDRLEEINQTSIAEDREYAGLIYEDDGSYFATPAVPGDPCASGAPCSSSPFQALSMVPSDGTITGMYHTHGAAPSYAPNMFSNFSSTDVRLISRLYRDYGINNSYLATPQGNMLLDYGHTNHNDAVNLGRLPN